MRAIIVARLSGGLGNQLFQYAAACGIAHGAGGLAALDASDFVGAGGSRKFALDGYDLGVPVLSASTIAQDFRSVVIPRQAGLDRLGRDGDLTLPLHRENDYDFEPATKALRDSTYLYGFWQSPKYFAEIADRLRDRLAVPTDAAPADELLSGRSQEHAVAVHVRRGDYLVDQGLDSFGLCAPAYYDAAIAMMRDKVAGARFLVFSDDPEWCRGHFAAADMTVVSAPGGDARNDLAVMARCRHHVIANSSLGWWGGFLGERAGSIVIAPIPWYTQAPHAVDLVADRWLRLDRRTGADWRRERGAAAVDRISVVVLAGERSDQLSRAVDSACAQTHRAVEIVIAPRDPACASMRTAERLARRDDRIRLAAPSGVGPGPALDAAIAMARGEWVAFLDACDVWHPDKLRIQVETAHLTGADVVCCRTVPVEGPDGTPEIFPPPGHTEYPLQAALEAGELIGGISHTLARTKILRERGAFGPSFEPYAANRAWSRLLLENRTAILWGRHVDSPVPFVIRRGPAKRG